MTSRIITSILLVLLCKSLSGLAERTAVCFLTREPAPETLAFAQTLANDAAEDRLDVFVVIDSNSFNVNSLNVFSSPHFIQIPNEQCREKGFKGATQIHIADKRDLITAGDKSLLNFVLLNRTYSFVWLNENDVFIPSTRALLSLYRLYSSASDLLINSNSLGRLGGISYWHCGYAKGRLLPPWANSMAN